MRPPVGGSQNDGAQGCQLGGLLGWGLDPPSCLEMTRGQEVFILWMVKGRDTRAKLLENPCFFFKNKPKNAHFRILDFLGNIKTSQNVQYA